MVGSPCFDDNGMKKGAWSEDEDERLRSFILRFGHKNWRLLPLYAGLARCGKSCRLRWINYLKPGIKKGNYTKQEEDLIIELHRQLGNKWSAIATKFPGRTDNDIKNHWHGHLKKRGNKNRINNNPNNDHRTLPDEKHEPKSCEGGTNPYPRENHIIINQEINEKHTSDNYDISNKNITHVPPQSLPIQNSDAPNSFVIDLDSVSINSNHDRGEEYIFTEEEFSELIRIFPEIQLMINEKSPSTPTSVLGWINHVAFQDQEASISPISSNSGGADQIFGEGTFDDQNQYYYVPSLFSL